MRNFTVEVHCKKPDWVNTMVEQNIDKGPSHLTDLVDTFTKPKYRLYIDNDLIVERDFIWSNETFVKEKVDVTVPKGTHQIRIDPIVTTPAGKHPIEFNLGEIKIPAGEITESFKLYVNFEQR
jgi:hypothetical protein